MLRFHQGYGIFYHQLKLTLLTGHYDPFDHCKEGNCTGQLDRNFGSDNKY
ncbi:MAG: hypothetical protein M3R08_06520 [Bacteroidota bacterium]|nr:hypothetical protein [Bacteroidota bacterium]